MAVDLRGANAIITGGSRGLGPVIAHTLARAGVNLALAARSTDDLLAVAAQIAAYGVRVAPVPADLTHEADRARLVQIAEYALGPIDILVNNAGIGGSGRFSELPPAQVERVMATNYLTPVLLARSVLPDMLARGRGHIISVSSLAGKLGFPFGSVYGASKAALATWSAAVALEVAGTGVHVSLVTPGYVSEVGMHAAHGRKAPWYLGEVKPEAVAQAVLTALRTGAPEIVVSHVPLWPLQIIYLTAPGLVHRLVEWSGYTRYARRAHGRERSAGDGR